MRFEVRRVRGTLLVIVVKLIFELITLKIEDVGYQFCFNKELMKLTSVFGNASFDENKFARCSN